MQVEASLKRTPLYETHQKLGGKLVPFAGWELPVQYSGVIAEHNAVRKSAGIFDVSHMGEVLVTGPQAQEALDYLTCNSLFELTDGKAQYNAILNEQGGVVDDIIIYRYSGTKFFVCVNASNAEKDFSWFSSHNRFNATFANLSAEFGQIALQGPKAPAILEKLLGKPALELQHFHFAECRLASELVIVARTGYTGEDGYELFVPVDATEKIFQTLMEAGGADLTPCGLGARDALRLEACYPLHGHELGDDISALESGLGWIVKFDKGDFIGKEALLKQKQSGVPRTLIGFFVDDAGLARHGDKVFASPDDSTPAGLVTSGTKTPTVNRALGLALVQAGCGKLDTKLWFEVRGKRLAGHVVKKPFYKRNP